MEKGWLTADLSDVGMLALRHGHEAMAPPWQGMGGTDPQTLPGIRPKAFQKYAR